MKGPVELHRNIINGLRQTFDCRLTKSLFARASGYCFYGDVMHYDVTIMHACESISPRLHHVC